MGLLEPGKEKFNLLTFNLAGYEAQTSSTWYPQHMHPDWEGKADMEDT